VRVFKTKTLARFARQQGIDDDSLVAAVKRAMRGLIDADLGGKLIKQRVARPGEGRRGGFRMVIGFGSERALFLYGFAKNERENISNSELLSLREIAATFLNARKDEIARAVKDGTLIEVYDDGKDEKEDQ
jgi:hypothetical protein